jgi:hypothetical protein
LTILAFVSGLALSLSTLQLGLAVDDWAQILRARGQLPELGSSWDLYRFSGTTDEQMHRMISSGPYPWWTKSEMRARFFRPLSSALIHFDVEVLGDHVTLWHLHSIAWYVALLAVALALYRRVLPGTQPSGPITMTAALALLLFAVDDAHPMPVGWLANRNSLVSAVPALFGVLMHLRWREDGWRPGAPLSALAYAVGLCGGESALGVLGFVAAYELTAVRPEPLRRRVLALVPLVAVFVSWAVVYRSLGYGAKGSSIYIDPFNEPGVYLESAPGRLLALLGSMTLALPSDFWMFLSKGRAVLVAGGLLGTGLFALLVRAARPAWSEPEWRRMRWLLCSALLALLPVLATFPTERLLLVPSIPAAGISAALLHAVWQKAGALARTARVLLVVTQGLAPLPSWVVTPWFMQSLADYVGNGVMHSPVSDAALAKNVLIINPPDMPVGLCGGLKRMLEGRQPPAAWHYISYAPYPHRVRRVAEDVIEVEVIGGRMLDTVMEQIFRAAKFPLDPGHSVKVDGLDLTVLDAIEGQPTKVRVAFTRPLSELTLLQWKGGRLVPFTLPAVGAEAVLEHELGPMDQLRTLLGG